jgi:deoxyuridine 5'-triphosphate nucleotidohydrolase
MLNQKIVKQSFLKVKKLSKTAKLPYKKHKTDAGYDLSADEGKLLLPQQWCLINTGLSLTVPEGTYGRIAPRSGFSWKSGTIVGAGVIDADYTGPVKVLIHNVGNKSVEIKKGDRIAQLIIEKIVLADVVEVTDLNNTERGQGGFGSTGKN